MLFIASWTDIKKKEIPNWLSIGSILIAFFYRMWTDNASQYILGAVFIFVALSVLYFIMKGGIGGGDLKLFVFLGLVVGYPLVGVIALISFMMAVMYSAIVKQKGVILAPFITVSFVMVVGLLIR